MIARIAPGAAIALAVAACSTASQDPNRSIPVRGETPGRTCDSSAIDDFVGRQRSPKSRRSFSKRREQPRFAGFRRARW